MARPKFKNRDKLPYNTLLYEAVERCGVSITEFSSSRLLKEAWSLVHIHWPDSLLDQRSALRAVWSAISALGLLDLARARGARLVWTVHDVEPHDWVRPNLERRFWKAIMDRVDAVIALSEPGLASVQELSPRLRHVPSYVIPHGHFRGFYNHTLSRESARQALGLDLDRRIIGFFGQVRPYKNLPHLIKTFQDAAIEDALLLIAGRPNKRSREAELVRDAAGSDQRIRLAIEFIVNHEVQLYVLSPDLMVFPFRKIWNSGSVILALSFDRPVLVPNVAALRELAGVLGPDWVRTYDEDLKPADLRSALDWAVRRERPPAAPLHHLDWDPIARQTIAAYKEICSTDPRAR